MTNQSEPIIRSFRPFIWSSLLKFVPFHFISKPRFGNLVFGMARRLRNTNTMNCSDRFTFAGENICLRNCHQPNFGRSLYRLLHIAPTIPTGGKK